ncbi:MAG TPA: site-specific DNA-methyltransferase [Bacilli bacterium]|nr:site-specific DNA-methyltransferase [Bacilli bacterium]
MNKKLEGIELSWIGKNNYNHEANYVLSEKSKWSYSKGNNQNMLIHGDNLGALELLRKTYRGKIKCIYLDPPYNSLLDFRHYSDKYTHSDWLSLMHQRLLLLKELLAPDGFIFVQLDNRELHYLKIIMDEIFGRDNYRNSIIVNKTYDAYTISDNQEAFKTGYDTILLYSRKVSSKVPFIFKETEIENNGGIWKDLWCNNSSNNYLLANIDPNNGGWRWEEAKASRSLENYELLIKYQKDKKLNEESFTKVFFKYIKENKLSLTEFNLIRVINSRIEYYIPPTEKYNLSDDWTDITVQGLETNFEHEVNEELLRRIINNFTNPEDIVLDAFLGSGTTITVAQKLYRSWIGIEQGEHIYSHCVNRLKKVIDQQFLLENNKNQEKLGYKFYELVKKEEK